MHKLTGNLLDTNEGLPQSSKWIFVMSTSEKLYVGQVRFNHKCLLRNIFLICVWCRCLIFLFFFSRKRREFFIIQAS